jgi:hypothetical protein
LLRLAQIQSGSEDALPTLGKDLAKLQPAVDQALLVAIYSSASITIVSRVIKKNLYLQ